MNMEQEMEMTRDELNKMTMRDLIVHLKQHGKRPNRQSMIKGHIIDLIIQEGFNRPPPVLIQECSECAGPIYQGEPMAKFFCMAGWICQHCLRGNHLLKCPDTIKRNFTDSEEAKDDSEGELNQLD